MLIHGLWLHPSSWAPWEDRFRRARYEVLSPSWPGDLATVQEARANPESVANRGIDEIVDHHAKIIEALGAQPILIGHSFGGMFAEKLLGEGEAAAAVAIDAVQIKGVLALPLAALHSTLPVFKNPANKHRLSC
jgi:pimeloyl-ACP methyl ester carboxylesterase